MISSSSPRPPLDPNRVQLPDGYRLQILEEATSTNALAAEDFSNGGDEGLVLLAEHQSAGRGRLDRHWVSIPRSGVVMSVVKVPTTGRSDWSWLPLLTGMAVADALYEATGVQATLKWPNDVMISGQKVGGILLERVSRGVESAAILGIGINVHHTEAELPTPQATSVALHRRASAAAVDRSELVAALVAQLDQRLAAWSAGKDLRSGYIEMCSTLGQQVRVLSPSGERRGVAVGIDTDGQLLLESSSGVESFAAGDVEHLRPANGV